MRFLACAMLLVAAFGCARRAEPTTPAPLPAVDVDPTPRGRLRDGGTLRRPIVAFPAQWNYNHALGMNKSVSDVIRALMPQAFRTDADGVPHPDPDYVLDAVVTDRSPRQVVDYTLDPRATWSDGTPIDYRDYVAQWRALSGRDRRFLAASSTGYRRIASVTRGRDDFHVRVVFRTPFADWRSLFAPLYPAATNSDPDVFNNGWRGAIPVTAGPFRVAALDATAETVTLVRDPHWWGRPAMLDTIVYRTLDIDAQPGAFAGGEIDLMDVGSSAEAYRRAAAVDGAVIRRAAGPDWRHITMNAARPALSDVRVRRAIAMAVDRTAIARSDLTGLDCPVRTLGNHFLMNGRPGYEDHSIPFDPAKAGRLLDRAGWHRVSGVRTKDGTPLTLDFVVPAGAPTARREGELTRAMLRAVGITVKLRTVPVNAYFEAYIAKGDFDITAATWGGTPYPVSANRSIFARPHDGHIGQNYARVGSAAIDRAMDRASRRLDPVAARRAINEADRLIWQEAAVLPLYQRPQLVAVRGDLANAGAWGFSEPVYQDIGYLER